jgi:uncharacterized protein (TIGR02246 family)
VQAGSVQDDWAAIVKLVRSLRKAWNTGDSTAFASHFAEDGDLVNIHGMRISGRAAIASIYDLLFRSVFRRSRVESELSGSRKLCDDAILVHMRVEVHIPLGPMAGIHDCVCSAVLQRTGDQWRVASLHNTLVSDGVARQLVA